MVTTSFDRLRPRTAPEPRPSMHDSEGKRALFSSHAPEVERPGLGSVTVDCRRCHERTVLSPGAAVRAAIPSLVIGFAVGHGDQESRVGLGPGGYGAFLRCPACGRRTWTRLTIRL